MQTKFFIPHRSMFSPQDLPSHPAILMSVLLHPRRHMTIVDQQFRHEVRARIEGPGGRYKMIGRISILGLKFLARLQSKDDGFTPVQIGDLFPRGQSFHNFVIDVNPRVAQQRNEWFLAGSECCIELCGYVGRYCCCCFFFFFFVFRIVLFVCYRILGFRRVLPLLIRRYGMIQCERMFGCIKYRFGLMDCLI